MSWRNYVTYTQFKLLSCSITRCASGWTLNVVINVYVDSNSIAVFADVSLLIAVVPQTDFIYYKQNKKGQQNDAFPYYIFLSVFFPAFFFYHTLNFTICHLCKLV